MNFKAYVLKTFRVEVLAEMAQLALFTISNILTQIPCQLLSYCSYVRVLWSNYR